MFFTRIRKLRNNRLVHNACCESASSPDVTPPQVVGLSPLRVPRAGGREREHWMHYMPLNRLVSLLLYSILLCTTYPTSTYYMWEWKMCQLPNIDAVGYLFARKISSWLRYPTIDNAFLRKSLMKLVPRQRHHVGCICIALSLLDPLGNNGEN